MNLNTLEANIVTELGNDTSVAAAFTTIRRGRPEGLPTSWFEPAQLPALIVELKHPIRTGMATIAEKEHIIPALLWVVTRATTRETVRQACQTLIPVLDDWADNYRGNDGTLGTNVFMDEFDPGDVDILQMGELFYGFAKPGLSIRAFEEL